MMLDADLEIRLEGYDESNQYRIRARLDLPDSDAPMEEPDRGEELVVEIDLEAFRGLGDREYGQKLAESLFAPGPIRDLFVRARSLTRGHDPRRPLRLRLHLGPGAQALHTLRWELLHDPEEPGRPLAMDETLLFSRYLPSADERRGPRPSVAKLKALVVVANPSNVGGYQDEQKQPLALVDVPGELKRAREGLAPIPVTALCSEEGSAYAGPPTLNEVARHLREGYEVLYLAAHGTLSDEGVPLLFLEDEAGQVDVVAADDGESPFGEPVPGLASQLSQLRQLPRLAVLASCESGGAGDEAASRDTRALAALGPRLVEAGVPAVLAMQGRVTMKTIAQFMPVFFEELRRDGSIDRAVVAARRAVRDRPDWWVPVLYTRLDSGQLFEQGLVTQDAVPVIRTRFNLPAMRQLLLEAFTPSDTDEREEARWSSRAVLVALVAGIVLVILDLVLPTWTQPVEDRPLRIAVAEFGEGSGFKRSDTAGNLTDLVYRRLKSAVDLEPGLEDSVTIVRVGMVRDEEEAQAVAEQKNAALVIWGWVSEQDLLAPSLTFAEPIEIGLELENLPVWYEIEISGEGTLKLSVAVTERTLGLVRYVVGLLRLRDRDYDQAVIEFSKAISQTLDVRIPSVSPDRHEETALNRTLAIYHLALGRTLAAQDQPDAALEQYHKAESYDPEYGPIYVGIGNVYYSQRDFEEALRWYERAVDRVSRTKKAAAYYSMGNARFHLGDYQGAAEDYQSAIDAAQDSDKAVGRYYLFLAMSLCRSGQLDRALESFDRAEELSTDQGRLDVRTERAKCFSLAHIIQTAIPTLFPTSVPMGTDTPTPTLFPSPTPTVTPSATPTLFPTTTPTPTPSATPTLFPTWAASPTPPPWPTNTPAPTSEVAGTGTPMPAPTATVTQSQGYPIPVLLEPEPGSVFEFAQQAMIALVWAPIPLAEEHWYEVQLWQAGEEPVGHYWTKENWWHLPQEYCPGDYYWRVVLVRRLGGEATEAVSPASETRHFQWICNPSTPMVTR